MPEIEYMELNSEVQASLTFLFFGDKLNVEVNLANIGRYFIQYIL